MFKLYYVPIFLLFTGCFSAESSLQKGSCDSVFVASDDKAIYLFEINTDINVKLVKKFNNKGNVGAFYDCKRNIVVSPYSHNGNGGVALINANDSSIEKYPITDDIGNAVVKYKSSFLFNTKLLKNKVIKKTKNYIPPGESIIDEKGKRLKSYSSSHLFDLDKKKIIKSYETDIGYSFLLGNNITTEQRGAITKINLLNNSVKKVFEPLAFNRDDKIRVHLPMFSFSLFVDDNYYLLTTKRSWNEATRRDNKTLVDYKENTLYVLKNGKMHELVTLNFKKPTYMVFANGKIYIFDTFLKTVGVYNLGTNQLSYYDLNLSLPNGWQLDSVGHTNENLILSFSKYGYVQGGIIVTNFDFTKKSKTYKVPMGAISITTESNIQTMNGRSIE